MKSFEVVCQSDSSDWIYKEPGESSITKRIVRFIKQIVIGDVRAYGPSKNEVCLVIEQRDDGYYKIAGYIMHGWYSPESFIRLDEIKYSPKGIHLRKYQCLVDRLPDQWLKYHLAQAVIDEEFELAACIRDAAKLRGVVIS